MLLLGELIIRDPPEQARAAGEQVRVVAHLPHSYEAREDLEQQGGELRLIHRIYLVDGLKKVSCVRDTAKTNLNINKLS